MKLNPGWEGLEEWLDAIEAAPAPKCVVTMGPFGLRRETMTEWSERNQIQADRERLIDERTEQ